MHWCCPHIGATAAITASSNTTATTTTTKITIISIDLSTSAAPMGDPADEEGDEPVNQAIERFPPVKVG